MLRVTTQPWSEMCECARRVLKRRSLEGKKAFPPGPQIFYHGQHCPWWAHLPRWAIQLGLLRGPHWPFPGPEQLARFCDIAIILLAIINSHGLHSLYFSHVPNWRARALQFEKLKKSEILGIASWALVAHGL